MPRNDYQVAFGAFKSGIRSSHFRYLGHSSNWRTYGEVMKQAAIHAKVEYFNSKIGPSALQEELEQQEFSAQKLSYATVHKSDGYQPDHKRKDTSNHRQENY